MRKKTYNPEVYKRYYAKHHLEDKFKKYRKQIYKKWAKKYPLREKLCKRLSIIKQRCINPKYKDYKNYGAKGIKCLLTWKELVFIWNRDKANRMKYATLDRIDSKKDYVLYNCHFIEQVENVRKAHLGIKHG